MKSGTSGYSLLEVLIAFVVMTAILSVLLPGQSRLLESAAVQEEKAFAGEYALSRMARLQIEKELQLGTEVETYHGWQVVLTLTPVESQMNAGEMLRIGVKVADRRGRILAQIDELWVRP